MSEPSAISPTGLARPFRRRLPVLSLALQGGGAHGAFTWGVLDRLLAEEELRLDGVSGTSAGALNAVALASGWLAGGPAGARHALAELWRGVAGLARLGPVGGGGLVDFAAEVALRLFSPYQLNPLDLNPLRQILNTLVDFERLRRASRPRLFIAATNVRTAGARIFRNHELTTDVVLASACLPEVQRAVEIDGEPYWDGGFASNPPLLPLVSRCAARDVVLVQINPLASAALPTSAPAIRNRVAEIMFGRPLADELARLQERRHAARRPFAWLSRERWRVARHRLHAIDGSPLLARLDPVTKIRPDWVRLLELKELGRAAAEDWLAGRGRAAVDPERKAG